MSHTPNINSAAMGNNGRYNNRFPAHLQAACVNPSLALNELDKYESEVTAQTAYDVLSEQPLKAFVKMFWHVLEKNPKNRFRDGWVIDALCDHYEAIASGHIRKLLINVPPGFMKSMLGAFFTAWLWGPQKRPYERHIWTSYAVSLSLRDNDRCRDIVKSDLYRKCWGSLAKVPDDTRDMRCIIDPGKDSKGIYQTTERGWRLATSVKGTGTGLRGDFVGADDLHNIANVESAKERENALHYFTEVLPSRVNDPETASFIVVGHRTHGGDVSGHILGMVEQLGYDNLCIPMEYESDHPHKTKTSIYFNDPRTIENQLAWPERYTNRHLEKDIKPILGTYAYIGQYQQRPESRGGNMFKREWWRFYKTSLSGHRIRPLNSYKGPPVELPEKFDRVVASIDASFKGDADGKALKNRRSRVSIGVIGHKGPSRYVLDCITRHMEFDETCNEIVTMAHLPSCSDECRTLPSCPVGHIPLTGILSRWMGIETLMEDKANGSAIIRVLGQRVAGLVPVSPQGGKTARAQAMQPAVKSGHYFLPDGAPWVIDFVDNHASFPTGNHDDEVDMLSQEHIHSIGTQASQRAAMMSEL